MPVICKKELLTKQEKDAPKFFASDIGETLHVHD